MKYGPFMLAGLLIAIAGLASALVGTSFTVKMTPDEVYDGRVVKHENVMLDVPTGNRAQRRDVQRVRITVDYTADATAYSLHVDRALDTAETLPLGTPVLVYGKGDAASLNPDDQLLGPVLTFGGVFLFFFGSLGIYLGWAASRRVKTQ